MTKLAVIFPVLLLFCEMARGEHKLDTTETPMSEEAVTDQQFTTRAIDLENIWDSSTAAPESTTTDEILFSNNNTAQSALSSNAINAAEEGMIAEKPGTLNENSTDQVANNGEQLFAASPSLESTTIDESDNSTPETPTTTGVSANVKSILRKKAGAITKYIRLPTLFQKEKDAEDSLESSEEVESSEISEENSSTPWTTWLETTTALDATKPSKKSELDLPTIFAHLGRASQGKKNNVTVKKLESASSESAEQDELLEYTKKKGFSVRAETVNFYITFIDKYNLKAKEPPKIRNRTKVARSCNKI